MSSPKEVRIRVSTCDAINFDRALKIKSRRPEVLVYLAERFRTGSVRKRSDLDHVSFRLASDDAHHALIAIVALLSVEREWPEDLLGTLLNVAGALTFGFARRKDAWTVDEKRRLLEDPTDLDKAIISKWNKEIRHFDRIGSNLSIVNDAHKKTFAGIAASVVQNWAEAVNDTQK